ncbi:rhodanese domain-containing protein [Coprinopsis marcescibilis]|uniref:Rhodanese domain-containing protein n=1 Tax=Coprinopsis marcescibilis TaxID=230819 RepID=A0A5C3L348_COPMA|nr:rhodanese domain-containing protein [Coprinopsis marcescibilis]
MIGYTGIQRTTSASGSSVTTSPASILNTRTLTSQRGSSSSVFPSRTLDDVRNQVAQEMAVRAITKGETVDGTKIGVYLSVGNENDAEEDFLRRIATSIVERLRLIDSYLFVLASSTNSVKPTPSSLIAVGSSEELLQRCMLLVSSKFIGRVESTSRDGASVWSALIQDLGSSSYDDKALWDVVRKAARQSIDPLSPPPGSRSINQLLMDARAKFQRITATEAWRELEDNQFSAPTFLVDIRPKEQRDKYGGIRGSLIIERNVLEWRLDPRSDSRLAIADRYDLRVIVFCQEGYTSSLAAYALQQLGLLNATDIIGGYEAWRVAGLPVDNRVDIPEPRSLASLAGSVV